MKNTKAILFFNAWHSDFKRSGIKTRKIGDITLTIRQNQIRVYNQIRAKHIAERRALTSGK